MTKLGAWPQDIYYLSWMTQRLANRAPEWTHGRKWSWSVMQQLLNPIARDLERVHKGLVEERNNTFMSATNIDLLDRLYRMNLGVGMTFDTTTQDDGVDIYKIPTVYATIDDVEKEITIAHKNDIESLAYTALPSRIESSTESYSYSEVIPRITISDLKDTTPNEVLIPGHLYITIRNNTTWEYRGRNKIFYPKVYIKGTTRKGTSHEEAIPIRYNGTFKTIYQWELVEEVFVSYLDDNAEITIETLPLDRDMQLDLQNLIIPASGDESWRFLTFRPASWGTTLIAKHFVQSDLDVVRMGFDGLDRAYEIELQDTDGSSIYARAFVIKPNSDYTFVIDDENLYVYTTKIPYPDLTVLEQESPDTKMNIYSDRWLYAKEDIAVIKTDILDVTSIPWQFRWTLREPDGSEYYLKTDGSRWPTTIDAWVGNDLWERGVWNEQRLELLVEKAGVHIVTLECLYSDSQEPNKDYTLTTRFLYYVPVATPETVLALPEELKHSDAISFDADGQLWFYKDNCIYLGNVAYDYFLADYEKRAIWLREDYTSVRVVV